MVDLPLLIKGTMDLTDFVINLQEIKIKVDEVIALWLSTFFAPTCLLVTPLSCGEGESRSRIFAVCCRGCGWRGHLTFP